ncbi:PIN-like domain-containing protein [Shewanella algae]
MKNIFKGFHNVNQEKLEELWKDEQTLFAFDANVLLNLYGYAIQTRNDFFNILESIKDNLWIPYHAGLEYQRRRLTVIKNEKSIFNEIENNLEKIQNVFKGDFEQLALKRRFPKLFENTEKLEKEINKSIGNYKKSVLHWNNNQPCVRSHDAIRDKINELFDGKVGSKPENQNWLDDLYKEGAVRFKNQIPPGFKDAGKSKKEEGKSFHYDGLNYERQYGDLILWKQLIAKANDENIKNVVFVTDDAKEDWWYKINSNGNKVVGPLAELQAEIYSESNIDAFHMYSTSMFMADGESYKAVKVEESSIIDAQTSHISSIHKAKINNWIKLSKNQNKRYRDIIDSEIFKYGNALENSKLAIDTERLNDLNKPNEELVKQLERYELLIKQSNLEKYKDIFEKYNYLTKNINLDSYENDLERYDLINPLNKSQDEDDSGK